MATWNLVSVSGLGQGPQSVAWPNPDRSLSHGVWRLVGPSARMLGLLLVATGMVTVVVVLLLGGPPWSVAGADKPTVRPAGETRAYSAYTVQPGDSLWTISERVRPSVDPRLTIGQLREVNGSELQVLRPGQTLLLP